MSITILGTRVQKECTATARCTKMGNNESCVCYCMFVLKDYPGIDRCLSEYFKLHFFFSVFCLLLFSFFVVVYINVFTNLIPRVFPAVKSKMVDKAGSSQ